MRQDQALYVMTEGKSVFLTGPAGSGKTFLLNKLIQSLRDEGKEVAITASTGIAATHIGGMTIHSWSGLGIRDRLSHQDKVWLTGNTKLVKRYNMTDVLIIDEVSMLHGSRLDMINESCKLMRQNHEPFGGLQVILTGDLFQLPPVNRSAGADDFIHTSAAWQELKPHICYLTSQYRQRDGDLLHILEALRTNEFDEMHTELLSDRVGTKPADDEVVTKLYTHNVDVDIINNRELSALSGPTVSYEMETSGRKQNVEQLQKSVLTPQTLELKVGAEIMFVANNFAAGYANGTRGKVIDFDDDGPLIQLHANKRKIKVESHIWRYEEDGRERATVSQLPLRLAWAITIHKSQGMSLDAAIIDLSRAFTYGMGYVALSRVRSIEGLYLNGINNMALRLHPDVFLFDATIRQASLELASKIGEVPEAATKEQPSAAQENELFQRLRDWRSERAAKEGIAPYMIAHDKTLKDIARRTPKSNSRLLAVNGFGIKKLEQYGPDILHILNSQP